MMQDVFICDYIRTPIGRFGGGLSTIRPDDLGAVPLRALIARNTAVDWAAVDDVIYGCANQAGEDNRNVARMSLLLAGLPETVSGTTINRLCGSGMDAVITGARAIRAGEADLIVAGGVESMSRAPFVMPKAESAFSRANAMIEAGYDELTHINQVMLGWVLEADEDTRTLLRLTALACTSPSSLRSDSLTVTCFCACDGIR